MLYKICIFIRLAFIDFFFYQNRFINESAKKKKKKIQMCHSFRDSQLHSFKDSQLHSFRDSQLHSFKVSHFFCEIYVEELKFLIKIEY